MNLIERISDIDPVHADTMRERPTEVQTSPLPFYARHQLLRATVQLPHRPLVLEYLDDGDELVQLAGSPADIYKANASERLKLAPEQVAAYLKFFVQRTEPKARLVENAEDLTLLGGDEHAPAREQLVAALCPQKVERTDAGYRVTALVLTQRVLRERVYFVEPKGTVKEQSAKVLMENAPVPYGL